MNKKLSKLHLILKGINLLTFSYKKENLVFFLLFATFRCVVLVKLLNSKSTFQYIKSLKLNPKIYTPVSLKEEELRLKKVFYLFNIDSCLIKSLITYEYLNLKGLNASLFIGVKKKDSQFMSHSWIKVDTELIFESNKDILGFQEILIKKR